MSEFDGTLITLEDENGQELEFEHLDTMELDGKTYMALVPVYDDKTEMLDADGELVILEVMLDENGEEILCQIEDMEEFQTVADAFEERLSEECEFRAEDGE